MTQKYVIGMDISKSKLDCAVMDFEYKIQYEMVISNAEKEIVSFLKSMEKLLKTSKEEVLNLPAKTRGFTTDLWRKFVQNQVICFGWNIR
jgi:predicted NBD/HSP70 family sugar kinase